jgi:RNA polymerase sigma-70 factor, ECF subfamily
LVRASTEMPHVVQFSPEADDIELLHRAGSGDSAAFHALVDRHAQRLYRLAVSLIGNAADAEDVLQETFIGAFRGLRSFEARSSVKTWLTRILVTQAAQWRRNQSGRGKQRRVAEPMNDSIVASAGSPDAAMDVQAALGRLSPEHREVLALREFERMSYEEIAEVLDVPRGTVESRLHRARSEMREKLKDYLP